MYLSREEHIFAQYLLRNAMGSIVRARISDIGYPMENDWWFGLAAEEGLTTGIDENRGDQSSEDIDCKSNHNGRLW